jgi:alkylated DNA repair dioxygenase AlkB
MTTLIKTKNSSLEIYTYSNTKLIEQSVEEIEGKLLIHPPIFIYGKQCSQARNIGFFSDTSLGYKYSNQLAKSQPLTLALKNLLDEINKLFSSNFNGILVNEYINGEARYASFDQREKIIYLHIQMMKQH